MPIAIGSEQYGWLRGPGFDLWFIIGISLVSIATGLLVANSPNLFLPVLGANLWFLGYHHVIATFTRLAFDKESFNEHKSLILYLPVVVAGVVTGMVLMAGLWVVPTIYLYWQWYHYTRQSEGICKAYIGKSADKNIGDMRIARIAFYLVPISGLLTLSYRSPEFFLFMPLKTFPVPTEILILIYVATAVVFGLWVNEQRKLYRQGKISVPYVLYMLSHFSIYFVAYIYMNEVNYGWLVINIWHNAQYVLFVWSYNNRRFGGKLSRQHLLISTISQNGRFLLYIATCLTLSTAVYYLIDTYVSSPVSAVLATTSLATSLIIYQTLNFHHYIVDSIIWKLKKKSIRNILGLN